MPKGIAEIFNACSGGALELDKMSDGSSPGLLRLTGYIFDLATNVLDANQYEAFWDAGELCRILGNIQRCVVTNAKDADACSLGTTLIIGTTHNIERATKAYCNTFSTLLAYIQEVGEIPHPPDLRQENHLEQYDDLEQLWVYHQALYNALDNRRFFVTATGSIGVGPSFMQLGDVIAVMYGCKWPVMLRPVDNGHYRVLGTCYVHDIMDGEAVQRLRAAGRIEDEFVVE
jgi:hypothetical protein